MKNMTLVALVAALAAGIACPLPPAEPTPSGLDPGFTACGDATCQPGQYCAQPALGSCLNGCTSDANCEDGHVCKDISDVTGEGTCSEGQAPGEGEGEPGDPPPDALQACLDACDAFADCGMKAIDYNDCLNTCPDLSENQQRTIARCGEGSCSDSLNCLDRDCFNNDDCGGGEQCVGSFCL